MSFERGRSVLVRYRAPLGILRVAPRRLAVGVRRNQFSRRAIEHVKKSVAVGLRDQMLAAGAIGVSIMTGTCVASQSCSSCLVNWKYQFILPVSAFSASRELL